MSNDRFQPTVWVLLGALAFLSIYPIAHNFSPFLQKKFRTYFLLADSRRLTTVENDQSDTLYIDNQADTVFLDSTSLLTEQPIQKPQPQPEPVPVESLSGDYNGLQFLAPFFETLRKGEEQVRIAYYGDSSIEGDLMCQDFREAMQSRFGGEGVGFVPPWTHIPGFRRSIRQWVSNNWDHNQVGQRNSHGMDRGIDGAYYLPEPLDSVSLDSLIIDSLLSRAGTWPYTRFRGSRYFEHTKQLPPARLFYGTVNGADSIPETLGILHYTVDGIEKNKEIKDKGLLNVLPLTNTACKKLDLRFYCFEDLPVYGISFESANGVIVDNFSQRGNSGGALRGIRLDMLTAFQEEIDYDLIVLQYGLNVLSPNLKNFAYYTKELVQTAEHFQEAMPGVPILIIGLSDKATRINGRLQTDPSVPRITVAQRKAASISGTAFFSLYQAMGGEGSMQQWVEEERPPLANTDYTHFNFQGARIAGGYLFDYLMEGLEEKPIN